MNKVKSILKDYALEIAISLIAIVLVILNPGKAYTGFKQALENFRSLLLVMIGVSLLSGYVSVVVSKETIRRYVGKESGFKGVIAGALFGSLMVGPAYMFFSFFKEMVSKGAKPRVVAASITAWAVKLPWIPFMIALLGAKFAIVLNLLIFLFAIVCGYLVELFLGKAEEQR